jgi:deoxyribonuclease V
MWPTTAADLEAEQRALAEADPAPWRPPERGLRPVGCWVCFPRGVTGPGAAGDPAWAAAVTMSGRRVLDRHGCAGAAAGPYVPGLMALRAGALLESAVRGLSGTSDVLLLDATARDHPRRCGLALHLGAVLDLPSVGVTHRPLLATGSWPDDRAGAVSPLRSGDDVVGCWVRTRAGTRPLAVHPGWRMDVDTAVEVVLAAVAGRRTPEPLRRARQLARRARARWVTPS